MKSGRIGTPTRANWSYNLFIKFAVGSPLFTFGVRLAKRNPRHPAIVIATYGNETTNTHNTHRVGAGQVDAAELRFARVYVQNTPDWSAANGFTVKWPRAHPLVPPHAVEAEAEPEEDVYVGTCMYIYSVYVVGHLLTHRSRIPQTCRDISLRSTDSVHTRGGCRCVCCMCSYVWATVCFVKIILSPKGSSVALMMNTSRYTLRDSIGVLTHTGEQVGRDAQVCIRVLSHGGFFFF